MTCRWIKMSQYYPANWIACGHQASSPILSFPGIHGVNESILGCFCPKHQRTIILAEMKRRKKEKESANH